MKTLAKSLWQDQLGASSPATYLLVCVLLGLAVIPGLATIRDSVVQEFGDLSVSLESIDQSYSFTLGTVTSQFTDGPSPEDPDGAAPACISLNESGNAEGTPSSGGGDLPATPE